MAPQGDLPHYLARVSCYFAGRNPFKFQDFTTSPIPDQEPPHENKMLGCISQKLRVSLDSSSLFFGPMR